MTEQRVGIGFDAHRFADGRALVLGGVRIDHPRGLEGWSDADSREILRAAVALADRDGWSVVNVDTTVLGTALTEIAGSFGTDPVACRGTFRNWDLPIRRQIFSGFRCARSARPDETA